MKIRHPRSRRSELCDGNARPNVREIPLDCLEQHSHCGVSSPFPRTDLDISPTSKSSATLLAFCHDWHFRPDTSSCQHKAVDANHGHIQNRTTTPADALGTGCMNHPPNPVDILVWPSSFYVAVVSRLVDAECHCGIRVHYAQGMRVLLKYAKTDPDPLPNSNMRSGILPVADQQRAANQYSRGETLKTSRHLLHLLAKCF
jgi:hypothetical protein